MRSGGCWSRAVERCQNADPTFPSVTAHALRHTAASLAISAGREPEGGSADAQSWLRKGATLAGLSVDADRFLIRATQRAWGWRAVQSELGDDIS
jgi:hypothetical protein